jgi:hypothetical protein
MPRRVDGAQTSFFGDDLESQLMTNTVQSLRLVCHLTSLLSGRRVRIRTSDGRDIWHSLLLGATAFTLAYGTLSQWRILRDRSTEALACPLQRKLGDAV